MLERVITLAPVAMMYRTLAVRLFRFTLG